MQAQHQLPSLLEIQSQTAEVHAAIRGAVAALSRRAAAGRILPALAVAALLHTAVGRQACNGLAIGRGG